MIYNTYTISDTYCPWILILMHFLTPHLKYDKAWLGARTAVVVKSSMAVSKLPVIWSALPGGVGGSEIGKLMKQKKKRKSTPLADTHKGW